MPTISEDHVALLGRLCGGAHQARSERLGLLGALLASPAGIWGPEAIRALSPLDAAATEAALGSLKRAGVLVWDPREAGYRVPGPMRPAVTALYLLIQPTPAEELVRAQAMLFQISRDDPESEQRTLLGLCEILSEDVAHLDDLAGRPLEEQMASAGLLERHVGDAEGLLRAIAREDVAPDMVGRALDLVGELSRGVAALLVRLAHHSSDQIPRGMSRRAPAELRAEAQQKDLAALADAVAASAGAAPRMRALPAEEDLARALRAVRDEITLATLPAPGELTRHAAEEPEPDALEQLLGATGGAPTTLAQALRAVASWDGAITLHHGAVRLHETLISRAHPGLQPEGELVTDPCPGVAHVSAVALPAAA